MIVNFQTLKNKLYHLKVLKIIFQIKHRLNHLQIVLNRNVYLQSLDVVKLKKT